MESKKFFFHGSPVFFGVPKKAKQLRKIYRSFRMFFSSKGSYHGKENHRILPGNLGHAAGHEIFRGKLAVSLRDGKAFFTC